MIHVGGPPGTGKTAFVEALLRSMHEVVICVRGVRDDSLRAPKESAPRADAELRRFREAGASAVACYRFPASGVGPDTFFMADFMQDYSTAVIIEGDCPLDYLDLAVFIAMPLPHGSSLLVRRERDHSAKRATSLDAWERAIERPDELARILTMGAREPLLERALANPQILAQARAELAMELARLRAAPPPKPTEHWALAPGYEGIERAQLVVMNARDEDERERGRTMAQEVIRIRQDDEVFKDVLGFRGSRIPVTVVVARLSIMKDPGLKKAVARVRRAIRSRTR